MSEAGHAGSAPTPLDPAAIYEAEASNVWWALRRLGVREADLADMTHDVFVTAFRRLQDFDRSRPISPWLFGIAFRLVSDYRKHSRNTRETLGSPATEGRASASSEASVEMHHRQLVMKALDDVEFERRAVFVMHELHGYSAPEISEALGIPLNTAYSRLRVARSEFVSAVRRLESEGGVS